MFCVCFIARSFGPEIIAVAGSIGIFWTIPAIAVALGEWLGILCRLT